MKNISLLACLFLLVFAYSKTNAQGDPNKATKEIVKAYKEKNADLLKSYATGVLVNVINENFFESNDAMPLVDIAKEWDGEIREIRYAKGEMLGATVIIANVYISDNPSGNLNSVMLTSYNSSSWKAFGLGITETSKDEFYVGSLEIPKDMPKTKEKPMREKGNKEFSVEMADGSTYGNPTVEKLTASLRSIDEDNFFLILNSDNGFIQTTISDRGYIVQYNEGKGMFEAESYFTLDKVIEIFKVYLNKGDWQALDGWFAM